MIPPDTVSAPVDAPTADAHTKLLALYRLWDAKRSGRVAPSRADLPAEELRPWMGHLLLADVVGVPRRFFLRLIGTAINEYDGADYTGRWLDEVVGPGVREVVLGQYDRCAREGAPRLYHYTGEGHRGRLARIDKLFLPLSEDGRQVNRILLCIYADFPRLSDFPVQTIQDLETDGGTLEWHPRDLL